jgi:hypothetical protein
MQFISFAISFIGVVSHQIKFIRQQINKRRRPKFGFDAAQARKRRLRRHKEWKA